MDAIVTQKSFPSLRIRNGYEWKRLRIGAISPYTADFNSQIVFDSAIVAKLNPGLRVDLIDRQNEMTTLVCPMQNGVWIELCHRQSLSFHHFNRKRLVIYLDGNLLRRRRDMY